MGALSQDYGNMLFANFPIIGMHNKFCSNGERWGEGEVDECQLQDDCSQFILLQKATTKSHNDIEYIANDIVLTWYGDAHGGCSIRVLHFTCEDATYNGGEVTADNGEHIAVGGGSSICQGLHELVC